MLYKILDEVKKGLPKAENTPSVNFDYNYPVKLERDEETKEVRWTNYQPRRQYVVEMEEPLQADEVTDVCNGMITTLQNAITLYQMFRDGKIDSIGYWDLDMVAYGIAKDIQALTEAKKESE